MTLRTALDRLLGVEGTYSDHAADKGGETFCGISRVYWPAWSGWGVVDKYKEQHQPIRRTPILDQLVAAFYDEHFWGPSGASQVKSDAVAWELFETAVNCSVHQSGIFLQDALNLLNRNGRAWPELVLDGKVGPRTLGIVEKALAQADGERHLTTIFNRLQATYYIELARRSPTQEEFVRGWLSRT